MSRLVDTRSVRAVAVRVVVLALLLAAPIAAQHEGLNSTISVDDGAWSDPATWDDGVVPSGPVHTVRIHHEVHVDTPGELVHSLYVGELAEFAVRDGADLTVDTTVLGIEEAYGTLSHEGGTSRHVLLEIGSEESGALRVSGGDLTVGEVLLGLDAWVIPTSGAFLLRGAAASCTVTARFRIGSAGSLVLYPDAAGAVGLTTIATQDLVLDATSVLAVQPGYPAEVGDAWDVLTVSGTQTGAFGSVVSLLPGYAFALDPGTPGVVRVRCTAAPAGDTCANAIPLALDTTVAGSTAGFLLSSPTPSCVSAPVTQDVWYRVDNPTGAPLCLRADAMPGSGASLALEVLDACGGSVAACADGTTVSWVAPAGSNARVRLATDAAFGTTYSLTVSSDACWTDVGGAGDPGVNGVPALAGAGVPIAGETAGVHLEDGPGAELVLAWLSLASAPFPALGGTVHAFPTINQLLFVTDPAGVLDLATTWPVGVPPGTGLWIQFVCRDGTVPAGLTLSNAVRATTPAP